MINVNLNAQVDDVTLRCNVTHWGEKIIGRPYKTVELATFLPGGNYPSGSVTIFCTPEQLRELAQTLAAACAEPVVATEDSEA